MAINSLLADDAMAVRGFGRGVMMLILSRILLSADRSSSRFERVVVEEQAKWMVLSSFLRRCMLMACKNGFRVTLGL